MSTEQENQQIQELQGVIAFGMDTQAFMGGQLGRFLQAKANAQIAQAQEDLCTANPDDPKAIRDLQNKVAVAAMFLSWMGEAVEEGRNAEREFAANSV